MITIENESLKASISIKGAELQSLFHKRHQLDYIWKGDPAFWAKHSPVLFPIVGALKNDAFLYQGKKYELSRHGFARDMNFEAEKISDNKAAFTLNSDDETKSKYPFDFSLKIHYELEDASIRVSYQVINPAKEVLHFSIGAHPAFAVPLTEDTVYEDYYLEFDKSETLPRWSLKDNLIDQPEAFLKDEKRIRLQKDLFYDDAIVFKNPKSEMISLISEKTLRGLKFRFEGFPFLGIWAAKDAPFVCIEPWCGIADSVGHNQEIEKKEGIIALEGEAEWVKSWMVECL